MSSGSSFWYAVSSADRSAASDPADDDLEVQAEVLDDLLVEDTKLGSRAEDLALVARLRRREERRVLLEPLDGRELRVLVDHVGRHVPADLAGDAELAAVHDAAVAVDVGSRSPPRDRTATPRASRPARRSTTPGTARTRRCLTSSTVYPSCCSSRSSRCSRSPPNPSTGSRRCSIVSLAALRTAAVPVAPVVPVSSPSPTRRPSTRPPSGRAPATSTRTRHHFDHLLLIRPPFAISVIRSRDSAAPRPPPNSFRPVRASSRRRPIACVIRSRTIASSTIAVPASKPSPICPFAKPYTTCSPRPSAADQPGDDHHRQRPS